MSPNSVAFGADYVKVVEDTPILSAHIQTHIHIHNTEYSFSDISFMATFAGNHSQRE